MAPDVQVIVCPAALQPDGMVPGVSDASRTSVIVDPEGTFCGPVLRIERTTLAPLPTVIVDGMDLIACRSLPASTLVTTVFDVSFKLSGSRTSGSVIEALAMFETVPAEFLVILPVMVITG